MTIAAKAVILLGCAIAAISVPCVLAPQAARKLTAGFPRNRPMAYLLTAVGVLWSAWLLFQLPFGKFEYLKQLIFILTPVSFFLITSFVDDLLAARALGGLFLLIPSPLLDVIRWVESDFRLVIVSFLYLLILAGACLILSPYLFRKTTNLWMQDDGKCRIAGAIGLAFGLCVAVLGLTIFQ